MTTIAIHVRTHKDLLTGQIRFYLEVNGFGGGDGMTREQVFHERARLIDQTTALAAEDAHIDGVTADAIPNVLVTYRDDDGTVVTARYICRVACTDWIEVELLDGSDRPHIHPSAVISYDVEQ